MADDGGTRSYVSQEDIPRVTLDEALRISRALRDYFGSEPTKPLHVADALEVSPKGGRFRELCGASIGYGLTEGGAFAEEIGLTPLGTRIVTPTIEGDDVTATREALLKPRVMRQFLQKYKDAPLPPKRIGENVLVEDLDVPRRKASEAYELIVENAEALGLLLEVKGKRYIDLDAEAGSESDVEQEEVDLENIEMADNGSAATNGRGASSTEPPSADQERGRGELAQNRKVFITHGQNRAIVDQLKELLSFGDFEPVVALEQEAAAIPVPQKVMRHMRSCSAAIIHVGTEKKLLDSEGEEHLMLNSNVLIEIGAALALYDRKFMLLVEDGVELPSNLQGLYVVRYGGEKLDYESTMRLLKAFNEFKK